MTPKDDFASLLAGAGLQGRTRRVRRGDEVQGTVVAVGHDSVFVDVGAGEDARIDRSECLDDSGKLVLGVGDRVQGVVVEVTEDEGARLSRVRSLTPTPEASKPAERSTVLEARVTELAKFGVFVDTKEGPGLVPARELILSPGTDHRRAYPVGTTLRVVVVGADPKSGRHTFSMKRVAHAEERQNYAEYAQRSGDKTEGGATMGTLGALIAQKLGVPAPNATEPAPPPKAPEPREERAPAPPQASKKPRRKDPPGVVRRGKKG